MRKLTFIITLIFAIVTLTANVSAVSFNPDFEVYSEAALLINLDTGEVIYEKNADKQLVPASLTKIMTAVLLIEK